MATDARVIPKENYVQDVTTNSGAGDSYLKAKEPLVDIYEERYAAGLDLWTGKPLEQSAVDGISSKKET